MQLPPVACRLPQLPLMQLPLAHCAPLLQALPFASGATQVLCGPQTKPEAQPALLLQLVGQPWLLPLHTYGLQLGLPGCPAARAAQLPVAQVAQAPVQALVQQTALTQNCPAEQACPQPPQLAASLRRSWQRLSWHSVWPVVQLGQLAGWQRPPTQAVPAVQVLPHAPQLALLVCRSAQLPGVVPLAPQRLCPLGQLHTPDWQLLPTGQARPQAPQLRASVARVTQPLPQAVWPAGQSSAHWPAVQLWPLGQAWPHTPQFWGSACRFRQAPLQALKPLWQLMPQTPALQVALPLAGTGQAWPQLPQLAGSDCRVGHWLPQAVKPALQL